MTLGSNLQGCELNVLLKKIYHLLQTHSMELPQWMPKCEMFGAHCFDAVISKEYYKQCQTNCIKDCKNVTFKQKG